MGKVRYGSIPSSTPYSSFRLFSRLFRWFSSGTVSEGYDPDTYPVPGASTAAYPAQLPIEW